MLAAAASVLLLAAVLSGAGGVLGSLVTAAFWVFAVYPSRRTREPSDSAPTSRARAASVLTALVIAFSFVLRWPIASHDVAHYVGPDEGEVVENVLEMIRQRDFDQRHPGYPGLHFYLQMLPARAHLIATGRSIPDLPRSGFYLGARRFTLVAGILAGAVVFGIGRRMLAPWNAALAAALVALSPLAFRESAVVNPDLMLMLFVTVSLYASIRLVESRSWSAFLLAGASVGLATAIKYTGVFAFGPYCAAWLLGATPRLELRKWLAGAAFSFVTFAVASPYTFLNAAAFVRGLTMHAGYYRAGELNAAWELTRQLATRGIGLAAMVVAVVAAARALAVLDRKLLVLLAYALPYWVVFSAFDRAFPRHALVLVPIAALFAAAGFEMFARRVPVRARAALAAVLIFGPIWGSVDLWRRALRPTPADDAARWATSHLPPGSRVLQDQYTPRLELELFRVHRLGVEERQFVGNYDWVMHSGYPPGLRTEGLREVARFDTDDALGDGIVVYQVPPRESLMPRELEGDTSTIVIGAGGLPYFGGGWYPPSAGAFETSRLSRGESSEIFFVLPEERSDLEAMWTIGAVVNGGSVDIALNDEDVGVIAFDGERETHALTIPAAKTTSGLNRMVLRYDATKRLNRRHPDTAVRFFRLELRKK